LEVIILRDKISVKNAPLVKMSNVNKNISSSLEDIAKSILKQASQLDWEVSNKREFESEIRKIAKEIKELASFSNDISDYIISTLTLFGDVDKKVSNQLSNIIFNMQNFNISSPNIP
jgi:uncharacterized protein YukE